MSGQLKEVRSRIKSVQSTQQITKAMKMVSAAKLRRAQDAIVKMRPYANKMQETLSNIISNVGGGDGMTLATERPVHKVLMIVITSDRGLCGAYNSNLIKLAKATMEKKYPESYKKGNVTIWSMGKKGYENFLKNKYNVTDTYRDIFLSLTFENVQKIAQAAIKNFTEGNFDVVEIVYSQFVNAASQRYVVERYLPVPKVAMKAGQVKADFLFDPHQEVLIAELMPKMLNTQLYKALLDAFASENGARMTSMDKASENANEMLRSLRISYNRARQATITTEINEIVGGAAALQG